MRKRRAQLRLSQEECADRAGVSRQEWNGMETGRRGIGPVNAARIAHVLGGKPSDYLSRPQPRDELGELRARVAKLEEKVRQLERLVRKRG